MKEEFDIDEDGWEYVTLSDENGRAYAYYSEEFAEKLYNHPKVIEAANKFLTEKNRA